MARTAIPIQDVSSQPPSTANVTLATADNVNNNMFINDGMTLLMIVNPTAGALSVTVSSVTDNHNRTGDLVLNVPAAVVGQSGVAIVGPLRQSNWNQRASDLGNVYLQPAAALKLGAVRVSL